MPTKTPESEVMAQDEMPFGGVLHGHAHTSCTNSGSAWLIRSFAAMSTCLPLRMNEAEFI